MSKATRQLNPLRLCVLGLILLAFVAACASEAPTAARTSPETDREALVALFNATGGEGWWSNRHWLSDAPLGRWHGVTTNARDRVTELLLSKNGLSGEIPAELGNLAYLRELELYRNELNGEIPPELGNLIYLRELNLYGNELSGEIPAELGNLVYLREFDLHGNELSGEIPAELGNLENLIDLYLDRNELSGEIPAELGNLVRLFSLGLPGNLLSECIPDVLYEPLTEKDSAIKCVATDMSDRNALVALYNATDGPHWGRNDNWGSTEPISEWSGVSTDRDGHVAKLALYDNELNGEIPAELGNLSNLISLSLGDNGLS